MILMNKNFNLFRHSQYMGAKKSKPVLSPQSLKDLQNCVDFTPEEIENWYVILYKGWVGVKWDMPC